MIFVSEIHTVLETNFKSLSSGGTQLAKPAPPCPGLHPQHHTDQMWCCAPEILVVESFGQGNLLLKVTLGYLLSWRPA